MMNVKSFMNRVKIFRDYTLKKTEVSSFPIEYVIDTCGVCNLKCPSCPCTILRKDTKTGMMELDTFETIIHKIRDLPGIFVLITARGEPLLNPNYIEFVKICKREGLKVGTPTNATRLTEDMSKQIIESGLDYIIFPFEGTSKVDYEKMRVGAKFEDVVANVSSFLSIKKQLNSKIFVSIQGLISGNPSEFYNLYRKKVIELFPDNYRYIDDIRLKPLMDYHPVVSRLHSKPCLLLWRNAYISFEGDVFSCFEDLNGIYVLGNLLQEDFMDIWDSKKMQFLRKMNLKPETMNKLETCKYCDLREEYYNIWALLASTIADPLTSRKFLSIYEKWFM